MTPRRTLPFRITLLLALVLIVTVLNGVRLLTAILWRGALSSYEPAGRLLYAGVSGAVWMAAGVFVWWCFARRVRYTRYIIVGAALAYAAWAWVDRFFVQSGPHLSWPFKLIVTLVLLAFVAAVALDPRNQLYFRKETYERKPEHPTTT